MKWLIGATCIGLLAFVAYEWSASQPPDSGTFTVDRFMFFYDLQGPDALPAGNQVDRDQNGRPDYVENIAARVVAASTIFTESFGMRHPLDSPRYRDKAQWISVRFKVIESNGSAGDAVQHSTRFGDGEQAGALQITLSAELRDATQTPAHELFHVFQNGYTMFKQRWYTEGTARWSEYVLKEGTGSRKPLPTSASEIEEILQQTYSTKTLWRRLAYILDSNDGVFNIPDNVDVRPLGYEPVVEDNRIYGYHFIRRFLEHLDIMDDIASRNMGLPKYDWPEETQKSAASNHYLLCALSETITSGEVPEKRREEVQLFLAAIDAHTDNICSRLGAF